MEGRREKRVGRREGEMKEGRVGGGKEGVKIRIGAHTWKISSLCDSKECNFILRFRRSHRATVCRKVENTIRKITTSGWDILH